MPNRVAPQIAGLALDVPADQLDEEIRLLLAAADALISRHGASASPASAEMLRAALAAVFKERLARLGGSPGDSEDYAEQLRRRLVRMSMDLGASEAELAELRQQLARFLAMGEWPAASQLEGGLAPGASDYQKKLELLTRIVEENIALRSRPASELDA